ncbi:MAG: hypothetical protein R8G66_24675 [Cytophagales bacterium]|nr:hypothetical protein [Cytophagales bacterium]
MEIIYNPFEKIAGVKAFLLGGLGMLAASALAAVNGTHFTGMFSAIYTVSTGWYVPFFELMLIWVPLTVLCALYCQFFGSTHYRLVDIIGTIAFSMIPYLVISVGGFIRLLPLGSEIQLLLAVIFVYLSLVWSLMLIFHALRVSGNLKEQKLWVGFIFCTMISQLIYMLFINKIYLFIL